MKLGRGGGTKIQIEISNNTIFQRFPKCEVRLPGLGGGGVVCMKNYFKRSMEKRF
jgi:hypothetical protein